MAGVIRVGTSSWADPGFIEEWYPKDLLASQRLAWYAQHFDAVELNSSFYAIPDPHAVERWVEQTPQGFLFDVKLHRLLSRHAADIASLPPDLRDEADVGPRGRVHLTPELERAMVEHTLDAVAPLAEADKLGAFLLQLTPSFSPSRHRLEELDGLIDALAPHAVAVEFRHRGWVERDRADTTIEYLRDRGAAFVAVDAPPGTHLPILPAIDAVTRDDLAYMRLHGRNLEGYLKGKTVAERFGWKYTDDELEEVARRGEGMAEQAACVHVMFNNNRGADAPTAAQRFRQLIGQDLGREPEQGNGSGEGQLRLA